MKAVLRKDSPEMIAFKQAHGCSNIACFILISLYTVTDVRLEQHIFPKISNLLLEHKPTIHFEHRPIF